VKKKESQLGGKKVKSTGREGGAEKYLELTVKFSRKTETITPKRKGGASREKKTEEYEKEKQPTTARGLWPGPKKPRNKKNRQRGIVLLYEGTPLLQVVNQRPAQVETRACTHATCNEGFGIRTKKTLRQQNTFGKRKQT